MQIESYQITNEYLVRCDGTSEGTQDKYYKDGYWYKADRLGREGMAEWLSSLILCANNYQLDAYVSYSPCLINDIKGCISPSFLGDGEDFITFYRLYKSSTGRDLAQFCSQMDYDDAIEYVISFVKSQTKVDVRSYLADTFILDRIILNEDRHFNNMGLIFDGTIFKCAPIFDNGKSMLIGNTKASESVSLQDKINCAFSKAFSPSFTLNAKYLSPYATLHISSDTSFLPDCDEIKDLCAVIRHQINKYHE